MTNAIATVQTGDVFRIGDQTHIVHRFELPADLLRKIDEVQKQMGDRRVTVSSNWDGFYSTLELRDSRLFLTSLEINWLGGTRKPIDLGPSNSIFCDWFSGELLEIKLGEHGRNILRRDLFLFKDGILIRTRVEKKPFWRRSL
jgi:hypothetical protein